LALAGDTPQVCRVKKVKKRGGVGHVAKVHKRKVKKVKKVLKPKHHKVVKQHKGKAGARPKPTVRSGCAP
jgi:hypothetical protein